MTDTNTETTQTQEESKTYSKEQYDNMKNNFIGQINDIKSELGTLSKEREERSQADSEAENQRLKANEDYKALIEKNQTDYKTELDELKANLQSQQNTNNTLLQDNALATNGITDVIQMAGLKAIYNGTQDAPDFSEWLTTQNLDTKPIGKPSGNAGNVNAKPNETLDQRLSSTDPKVRQAALAEQLSANMGLG